MQQGSKGGGSQNQIVRFQAADMEILRQVGEMGYATITDWEYYQGRNPLDPNQPLRTVDQAGPAVRLWEARVARGPLKNTRMLLKEFLPDAREVAEQELRVYTDLVDTYPATEDFGDAPVATLRGWFKTSVEVRSLRFRTEWQQRFPRAPVPQAGNVWLAFRWDAFKPMSELAQTTSTKEKTFWDKLTMPVVWGVSLPAPPSLALRAPPQDAATAQRYVYISNLILQSIASLVFLHERGVVHRSLGSPSVSLSTYEAGEGQGLAVKLRDFGFASRIARLDDETLRAARNAGATAPSEIMAYLATEDIYALGYALAETIFSSLATKADATRAATTSPLMQQWLAQAAQDKEQLYDAEDDVSTLGPVGVPARERGRASGGKALPAPTDQGSLKKLMEDIYDADIVGSFRDYCTAEPAWEGVVDYLDQYDKAGWKLLQTMIMCRRQKDGSLKKGTPKLLSDMTDLEMQDIAIPDSFVPTFTGDVNKVPTARMLLDSPLLVPLQRPWYARAQSDSS